MKQFEFDMTLTIVAETEEEARDIALNTLVNLNDTMGHSPHNNSLELLYDSCSEVEYESDDE